MLSCTMPHEAREELSFSKALPVPVYRVCDAHGESRAFACAHACVHVYACSIGSTREHETLLVTRNLLLCARAHFTNQRRGQGESEEVKGRATLRSEEEKRKDTKDNGVRFMHMVDRVSIM